MQTGLTQKPTVDAAGGPQACALTLHVIIVAMRFLAGTICARCVQEIRASRGREPGNRRTSRIDEDHGARRTATTPSSASPVMPPSRIVATRAHDVVAESRGH